MGSTAITLVAGHHGAVLPCIMAYNQKARSGVLLSCIHDRCLRYVRMYGDRKSKTGTVTAQVWWARWLSPRERSAVATFQLVPFAGDYSLMLDEYRHWLGERYNIKPPQDQARKIDEMFVGCIHGVALHSLGHYAKFMPYVDAVQRAGCTAIWGAGGWLDSCDIDRRAWMSRCQPQTRNFRYGVTTAYGGEKAWRGIVKYIHQKGLKYVAWMTGYGLTGFDPLFKDYPDAFVRTRYPVKVKFELDAQSKKLLPHFDGLAGRPNDWTYPPFGGCTIGSDTTHHAWRKFWLNNQKYWTANGVDGIFFDSFNPMPPNYALRPWPGQISLEINNLQREARRLARKQNPDFFSFTEGGGYLMASVNDFTHTYHGCDAPPLPPYRKEALSAEEEARFCLDEALSMLPGARSWGLVQYDTPQCRPRVLGRMFGGALPVMPMFTESRPCKPITNEVEYWAHFKARPANDPGPDSQRHYDWVGKLWKIRQAHPELKSGSNDVWAVKCSDPAVFAFLRRKGTHLSVIALNFREKAVNCKLALNLTSAGLTKSSAVRPQNLLTGQRSAVCSGARLARGIELCISSRDGVVLKLA